MKLLDVRGRRAPLLTGDLRRLVPEHGIVTVVVDRHTVVDEITALCRTAGFAVVSIDTIDGDIRIVVRNGMPSRKGRSDDGRTGAFPILR
jgi:TusA-related sulfurtransferase